MNNNCMNDFVKVLISNNKSIMIPEEENLYGIFVGEWDFDWYDHIDDPFPRHVKGEWLFQWILEGLAVQDVFICPSRVTRKENPPLDAAFGTTIRMYNPNKHVWDILYTEWGSSTCLEAYREDDKIIQIAVDNDKLRWVFSEITQNSFKWQRLIKGEDKDWIEVAKLYATRKYVKL